MEQVSLIRRHGFTIMSLLSTVVVLTSPSARCCPWPSLPPSGVNGVGVKPVTPEQMEISRWRAENALRTMPEQPLCNRDREFRVRAPPPALHCRRVG